jgi:predicted DNA-binding transcriptional regulator AlpA
MVFELFFDLVAEQLRRSPLAKSVCGPEPGPDDDVGIPYAVLRTGRTAKTLRAWWRRGLFPAPFRRGGYLVRWKRSQIDDFLAGRWQPVQPAAAGGPRP